MGYFTEVRNSGFRPRVHSLLLSLNETLDLSKKAQDIISISENDPRILESEYYIPPALLPPLEIHFSGQNSASQSLLFGVK